MLDRTTRATLATHGRVWRGRRLRVGAGLRSLMVTVALTAVVLLLTTPPAAESARDLSAPGGSAAGQQVAVDRFGNAHVVWFRMNPVNRIVQYRKISPDGSVGPTLDLSAAGRDGLSPDVAVDAGGNAWVVWYRADDAGDTRVQYARIGADGSVGSTTTRSAAGRDADAPRIDVDATGIIHVAWRRFDGVKWIVQYTRLTSTGIPGPTLDLSEAGQDAASPRMAVDAFAGAHVTWSRNNGAGDAIVQYRKVGSTGVPGSVVNISQPGGDASTPRIAVDSSGNVHLTWHRPVAGVSTVQYLKIAAIGWVGSTVNLSAAGRHGMFPTVATGASGDAHVSWYLFDGSNFVVQYARVSATGTVGATLNLSSPGNDASYPETAADSSGSAHVVWTRANGTNDVVQYRRVASDGSLGSVANVSASGADSMFPEIAASQSGTAHMTWFGPAGVNALVQYGSVDGPSSVTPPVISGRAESGQELVCSDGTWNGRGDDVLSITRKWRREGTVIPGAEAARYRVGAEDVAKTLTCAVSAENAGGTATAISAGVRGGVRDDETPPEATKLTATITTWDGRPVQRIGKNGKLRLAVTSHVHGSVRVGARFTGRLNAEGRGRKGSKQCKKGVRVRTRVFDIVEGVRTRVTVNVSKRKRAALARLNKCVGRGASARGSQPTLQTIAKATIRDRQRAVAARPTARFRVGLKRRR